MRLTSALLIFALITARSAFPQEPSLGDVARASRAQQARSPKPARVLSNEDKGPQPIKDDEDPLAVFQRARDLFLHDTQHRCYEQSSGNSGPGWRKSARYEVAAADRMRLIAQEEGSPGENEALLIDGAYYLKIGASPWRKATTDQEIAQGRVTFPGALIPQELRFGFQSGDLKPAGKQIIAGVPTVLYQYSAHISDFNRTVKFWFGERDNLPYTIEMYTETRSSVTAPVVWQESIHCSYNLPVTIEPPL